MDKTKCITFDSAAQEALPEHIKAKWAPSKLLIILNMTRNPT